MFFFGDCTWLDPQRTSYGFGYSSPWYLAGLVHALGGGSIVLGGGTYGGAAWWWSSSSSTSSGGCLRHKVLILGGAIYQTHLQDKATPGYGEGPGSRCLVQAKPGTWGPNSWPTATS
jgi:hypothetical protein